ncbi:hypothetical protein FACS1894199_12720 [Bacteroidia bacterium]|nr:hypothetical protein FACS1894199_12720 [Bacteroidia bacterium]
MNDLIRLSDKNRTEIFATVSTLKNLPPEAIEKDVWVTAVLRSLFALPYSNQISFKGGTSLSKCWNVIERFSDDVDVAINREYFGFTGETLSKREVNKKLRVQIYLRRLFARFVKWKFNDKPWNCTYDVYNGK